MNPLGQIVSAVDAYNVHVASEMQRARSDANFANELRAQWKRIHGTIEPDSW